MGAYTKLKQRLNAEIEKVMADNPGWREWSPGEEPEHGLESVVEIATEKVIPDETPLPDAELIALLLDLPPEKDDPEDNRRGLYQFYQAWIYEELMDEIMDDWYERAGFESWRKARPTTPQGLKL